MALYRLPFTPSQDILRGAASSHRSVPNSWWCVDFRMPEGTPIRAARSGVVFKRESRYSTHHFNKRKMQRCNFIEIEHDDGSFADYAHLSWRSVYPKIGERIRSGQVIGLSGWTGYAKYPHLHFGVYDTDLVCIRINWSENARKNMPAY